MATMIAPASIFPKQMFEVASVECEAATCTATLPLPDIPKPLEDAGALARLRLVDASDDCKVK
jgi:hypothetical protein